MSAQATGAFRCQRCGAPLEVTPETIVAVCPYCGTPNWTAQAYVYPIELVPARSSEARSLFLKWMETDPDLRALKRRPTLKSLEIIYVPLYIADTHAVSRYSGVAQVKLTRTRVVKRGKETTVVTESRTVTVTVSGVYERDYELPIVARRNYEAKTVEPLVEYFMKTRPPRKPIAEVAWDEVKGTVLASEIPPGDAEKIARDESCDRLSVEVEKRMEDEAKSKAMAMSPGWVPVAVVWLKKRKPCRSTLRSLSPIILVPMIFGVYSYNRSIYRAILAGWDGMKVYSEEPVSTAERIAYLAGAVGSAGLIGGGGMAAALYHADSVIGGVIAALIGGAFAYFLVSKAIADVKIEGVGE